VLLVTGSGLPTSSNTLCYINQAAKGEGDIVFDVYPLLPAQTTDLTLYITSKSDGFTTIAIPSGGRINLRNKIQPAKPGFDASRLGFFVLPNCQKSNFLLDCIKFFVFFLHGYTVLVLVLPHESIYNRNRRNRRVVNIIFVY